MASAYLTKCLRGFNENMNIKYLLSCIAHDRQSIYISYYYLLNVYIMPFLKLGFIKYCQMKVNIHTSFLPRVFFFFAIAENSQQTKISHMMPLKKSDLIKIITSMKLYRSSRLDSHAHYHCSWFAICIAYNLQSPVVLPKMQVCLFYKIFC